MAIEKIYGEFWGLTNDNSAHFIDSDGNEFKVLTWMDTDKLHKTREDAEASMNELDDQYSDLAVLKISFSMKVTRN